MKVYDLVKKENSLSIQWPVYESMAQCSSITKVPKSVLVEAKKMGCQAFKNNRVYFGEFFDWFWQNMLGDQTIDWGKDLERSKAMRERIKLAEDEDRMMDKGAASDAIAKVMATLFGELDRVYVGEIPARGAGMNELALRKLATTENEQLKGTLRRLFTELIEKRKAEK